MTATRFTEIDPSEVQKGFPKFYDPRGRFFEIVHTDLSGQAQPIGFVGIRPLGMDCELAACELSAFVFKQYRNALTKGTVLATLGLPQTLGFKRCWMATTLKTVAKLLNAMGKADGRPPYGVTPVGFRQGKAIFVREYCERKT